MGFRSWFWGFLFLFDFRLNGFDMLPDVAAYLFFAAGFGKMSFASPRLDTARKCLPALFLLSIPDLYAPWLQLFPGPVAFVYQLAVLLLGAVFVYQICAAIKERAEQNGDGELAGMAQTRGTLYLVMAAITGVPLLFMGGSHTSVQLPGASFPLVIALFVFSLIVLGLLMDLMKKCEVRIG
ncbi:hypothetical protein [Cohnella caldifontis]|uniref:hypothetical protein n=1 Tax=Cohnella caldifontis TaxID=3027471 RepID=UPI0023ED2A30|nr:hypothetical protein [Cohnella sp. YIM B05605]